MISLKMNLVHSALNYQILDKATTAQVVLVTVETLNGETPAEYALELGRKWGVGNKDSDNGIVVLLSTEEREIYIAVGYGLEGALPDSKTGRIIDLYGMEYLKANNFSKGLFEISNAVVGEVYIEYGLDAQEGYSSIATVEDEKEEDPASGIVSWSIMIVIIAVISIVFRGRGGIFFMPFPTGRGNHHGGFGGGGFGGFSGGGGSFGGGGAGRRF